MTPEETLPDRTDAIRECAYGIWQAEGCQDGHELDHWLRAERALAAAETTARAAPAVDHVLAAVTHRSKSSGDVKRARGKRVNPR